MPIAISGIIHTYVYNYTALYIHDVHLYLNGCNKVNEGRWGDPEGIEEPPAFEDVIG